MNELALQEAIQRAKQIAAAARVTPIQTQPVKRPAVDDAPIDPSQVKVTLAYEKPPGAAPSASSHQHHHHTSSSYNSQTASQNHNIHSNHHHSSQPSSHHTSGAYHSQQNSNINSNNNNNNNNNLGPPSHKRMLLSSSSSYPNTSSSQNHPDNSAEQVRMKVPSTRTGAIIGRGGETIKFIKQQSGCEIELDKNAKDCSEDESVFILRGSEQSVSKAQQLIEAKLSSVREARGHLGKGTNGGNGGRLGEGEEQFRMKVPANRTGALIGRGGETIKSIKQQSNCDIELDKNAKDCGEDESVFIIRGSEQNILQARALIEAKLSAVRDGRGGGNERGGHYNKGVATGANAVPVINAMSAGAPIMPVLPHQAVVGGPEMQVAAAVAAATAANPAAATQDMQAAWAAYYSQYYAQYQQPTAAATAVASTSSPQVGATAASLAQTAASSTSAAPSGAQGGAGQADYSADWVKYYRALGYHDQADQIEKMCKAKKV